jgi:N-6 DNA Methylase
VRLSLVNLYLHGFRTPNVYEYDSLTSQERWGDYFDVILANPPFMSPKGGITPHNRFGIISLNILNPKVGRLSSYPKALFFNRARLTKPCVRCWWTGISTPWCRCLRVSFNRIQV